jgi:hypothetical protein
MRGRVERERERESEIETMVMEKDMKRKGRRGKEEMGEREREREGGRKKKRDGRNREGPNRFLSWVCWQSVWPCRNDGCLGRSSHCPSAGLTSSLRFRQPLCLLI